MNKDLLQKIIKLEEKYRSEIIDIRHEIHMHPELGWQEINTSKIVQAFLTKYKIPFTVIKKIAVLGMIKNGSGPTILLRADMDALPINEETNVQYKSKIKGVMHACGHDCHTANLLAVAKILNELKSQWKGTIKFMFQPSEETGEGGALPMIDAGIMKNPTVDYCLGLHVGSNPVGTIASTYGKASGCPDDFFIELYSDGGHGAAPHKCADVISLGASFISMAQNIVSRFADPEKPALCTFGKFGAGTAYNVMPTKCLINGTLRCNDEGVRKNIYNAFVKLFKSLCSAYSVKYKFEYNWSYPPVVNNKEVTDIVASVTKTLTNKKLVIEKPGLGGEDFAYLCKLAPSCFFYIGNAINGNNKEKACQAHNPFFCVLDNNFFPLATKSMVVTTFELFDKAKK